MSYIKKYNTTVLRSIIGITSIVLLSSCSDHKEQTPPEQARPVKVMQIATVQSFNNRPFPGRAKASQEVNLSFNVNGSLVELPINIGDRVKKGQLIAKLEPREFDAKLKAAKAELALSEQNFKRAKELVGKGHISKADYDLIQAKLAISQSNVDLAEKALVDSVITAPFDGKIANLFVENYQTITNQQVVARLLDTSQIEFVVQIPEGIISMMPLVKNIVVEFDPFPKQLIPAQIKEISNEASTETRTYPVTLVMKQPDAIEILPGMAGKARGELERKTQQDNAITLPSDALLTQGENNKTYVWIVNMQAMTVHLQEVQIGELNASGVTVIEGIKPEEWIVTAGIHTLKEGDKVSILNPVGKKQ